MRNDSKHVITWRKNFKQRLVDSFGGKCGICGYDKCIEALEFHHLDPSAKDFGIGSVRGSPKSWEKTVPELRKCVMLCSNCHKEYHAGLVEIPEDIDRYNEEYTDYKEKRRLENYDNCPVCGELKLKRNRTCSLKCGGKVRAKTEYPEYEVLKQMVEDKGYCQVGRDLGVSDGAVRKRLKKMDC
jgi:hypothetical protein